MLTPYDVANPDPAAARRIFLDWLRAHPSGQLDRQGDGYEALVEWTGHADRGVLAFQLSEVFWEFVVEGIVAPGMNHYNVDLPWYHVTRYGQKVLDSGVGHPHDEEGYLARVRALVAAPDVTVMAYPAESVKAFRRSTPVARSCSASRLSECFFSFAKRCRLRSGTPPSREPSPPSWTDFR